MAEHVTPDVPSGQPAAQARAVRYLFLARFKATDIISGKQIEGLTADLSEGGCCIMTRRGPFSAGTPIRLEITRDGVSLETNATVIYNLRDQVMGLCFAEMPAEQGSILAAWLRSAKAAAEASQNH